MPWRKYSPKKGKFGSVYHVAKGIQVRKDQRGKWTVYATKNGLRKNKTIGEGRSGLVSAIKAAEVIAAKIDKLATAGERPLSEKPKGPRFKDYSRQWLTGNTARWSPYTQERYEQIFRLHIWPHAIFKKPLSDIGRKEIKVFLKELARRMSPATIEAVHGVISGVYNEAMDDELVGGNPSAGLLKSILPPKNRRDLKEPDPFSRGELEHFLAHAQRIATPAEVMILKVMAFAGLRLGEALAMRAEHLNPERRTYYVAQSYKCREFGRPKAGKTRLIDLPDFLVVDLQAYFQLIKKESLKRGRGGRIELLFIDPSERGQQPYSQRKVQMLVKRVCRSASLRLRNPHDLRHTYATLLLTAHRSPGYVQKQLGHSSISITMDVYCHWMPGEGREGLEEALAGEKGGPNRVRNLQIFANDDKGPR
jgi:integrase